MGAVTGFLSPDERRFARGVRAVAMCHRFSSQERAGGTLERDGHTEAAVDLPALAGLAPAGVLCELMNDDGTMARDAQVVSFARRHGLACTTVNAIAAYRRASG